jgi:hypothetical protein
MEDSNFSKYIEDRYFDQINWYDGKAQENQTKYRRILIRLTGMMARRRKTRRNTGDCSGR